MILLSCQLMAQERGVDVDVEVTLKLLKLVVKHYPTLWRARRLLNAHRLCAMYRMMVQDLYLQK
jgi:hypothetical protein